MHQTVKPPAYAVRRIGRINWIGLWTLYSKEVQRFMKVGLQTVMAPAITTILFFAIFMVALGGGHRTFQGMPFGEFLVPGLVMMAIVQNSFANTSSSLLIAKVQGNIVDLLMPPLSAGEMTFAFAMGGVTRGLLVAVVVVLPLLPFVHVVLHHPFIAVYYAVSASLLLSLVGVLGGVWSTKFDHLAAVTNFVIMPLSFLSGTFYSIDRLPPVWQTVSHFNPFFYAIDGLRYAFIDIADSAIPLGMVVMLGLNVTLYAACYWVFRRGYRLKD
ncbi:MAG: multidrug ABC transporter permease [Alphaproteobacteria bacterium]|nr:multidrug ABC transporter permease [Alphaproteobacteria bacterium]